MVKDKRKAMRRPMRYTAWVALGPDQLHGCVLADISDTGGRIEVENSETIPENFTLWLASNGSARRKCRIVWRKPRQIGVTFERTVEDYEQAPLVPKPSVEISSAAEATETLLIDAEPVKPA